MSRPLSLVLLLLLVLAGTWWILDTGPERGLEAQPEGSAPSSDEERPSPEEALLQDRAADESRTAVATDVNTTMERRSEVVVLVRGSDGSVCADACVRIVPEPEALFWRELLGEQASERDVFTDVRGLAALTLPQESTETWLVYAFALEGVAQRKVSQVELDQEAPIELQLEPSSHMLVRVTDLAGEPQAKQTVCWWPSPESTDHEFSRTQTDDDGVALFLGVDVLRGEAALQGTAFGVPGAFVERPLCIVRDAEASAQRIDLIAPDTGSLRVNVQLENGEPLRRDWNTKLVYELAAEPSPPDFRTWYRSAGPEREVQDGYVDFPIVEVGHSWQLGVSPQFYATPYAFNLAGPQQEGEQAEQQVTVPMEDQHRHRMLLLDPDGLPLRDHALVMRLVIDARGNPHRMSSAEKTDADGFLEFDLAQIEDPLNWSLRLEAQEHAEGLRWSGTGVISEVDHDLPHEVVMQPTPILVSGYLVDGAGKVPEGQVRYGVNVLLDGREELGSSVRFVNTATEPGRFELRAAEVPDRRLVLSARAGFATEWTDVEFLPGESNVRIEVPSQGWVRLSAGDNDPALISDLYLVCSLPSYDMSQPMERNPFSSQTVPRGALIAKTQFEIYEDEPVSPPISARAGSLMFTVMDGFGRILHQQGFELTAASSPEEPLELTVPPLTLQQYKLQLRRANGGAPEHATVRFQAPAGDSRWFTIMHGSGVFVGAELPPTMRVSSRGSQPFDLNWTQMNETVKLLDEASD